MKYAINNAHICGKQQNCAFIGEQVVKHITFKCTLFLDSLLKHVLRGGEDYGRTKATSTQAVNALRTPPTFLKK